MQVRSTLHDIQKKLDAIKSDLEEIKQIIKKFIEKEKK